MEKLRVDRSKAPLSIVLFYFHPEGGNGHHIREKFLASLDKNTRESDLKGWIDHDVIGLILPDTDEKGASRCIEKISNGTGNGNGNGNGNGKSHYSVISGSYPNDLIQKLLGEEDPPNLFPFDIDRQKEPRKIQSRLKRGMDILGSLVGLLLFSPFMLAIAIAIKATSPGPVVFKQSRFGQKGGRYE